MKRDLSVKVINKTALSDKKGHTILHLDPHCSLECLYEALCVITAGLSGSSTVGGEALGWGILIGD